VAGVLWPDTTEERAAASLRSTLWRVRRMGHALVDSSWNQLRLAPHVHVDVRDAISVAHALLSPSAVRPELLGTEILLRGELLPDWYEEWALVERERFRQIRLHALERLAELLAEEGRMGEAIEAGLTAVASEPLRESAHRSLIRVFLREGNRVDAIRQFELFRRLIRSELGADPSPAMMELVSGFKGR
jgi:DNA-binding SARP family transcriptional activator